MSRVCVRLLLLVLIVGLVQVAPMSTQASEGTLGSQCRGATGLVLGTGVPCMSANGVCRNEENVN